MTEPTTYTHPAGQSPDPGRNGLLAQARILQVAATIAPLVLPFAKAGFSPALWPFAPAIALVLCFLGLIALNRHDNPTILRREAVGASLLGASVLGGGCWLCCRAIALAVGLD